MTTKVIPRSPSIKNRQKADTADENGVAVATTQHASEAVASYALPDLPTFPLDVGYREVYDPIARTWHQTPLTLLDLLYPTEDDVGVVKMAQSPLHDIWTVVLATMLRTYLAAQQWLITHDVLIHWGRKGAPPNSPDIAAMLGGRLPPEDQKSYRVGRDGPLPAFVVEITSEETRQTDLNKKRLDYAAYGVKEYLIIDILTKAPRSWQLLGYRLESKPTYRKIKPDAQGGLTFATVGLRFVTIGRERIEVYNVATGERLLTSDELKAQVEAESARAEAEANARVAAEERATALAARVRELEDRYGVSTNG